MTADWQKRAEAAEKTVEVLKKKVLALYSCEATAFQRQLGRARDRQDRALRRRELMEVRAEELARYSSGLEVEVADRTSALTAILDNVTSGFLLIDANLAVLPGFTRSCHELFGATVTAGTKLSELLRIADPRQRAQLEMSIEQIFADVFPDEVALDPVPKRFAFGDRVLRVDARIVRRDGSVVKVLFTLNDISSLERAQREAKDNHVLIGILREHVAFSAFAVDTRELFAASRDALPAGNQVFVRRAIHTIKGNAAAFDLDDAVTTIHAIESCAEITAAHIDEAEQSIRAFFTKHAEVLATSYDADPDQSFDVAESSLGDLRSMIQRHPGDASFVVDRWTAQLVLKRADQLVGPLDAFAGKLAERLDKSVAFTIRGGDTMVDARLMAPIFQSIPHMLRNAVDHGIEAREERSTKPACGRVELVIEDRGAAWALSLVDDGRGIEPDFVAAQAVFQGFLSLEAAASMTRDEKLALVFQDGLSTAAIATEVSGRGVGMSAVEAAVRRQGGSIRIESTPGQGTSILLLVPKPVVLVQTAPLARSHPHAA